MMPKQKAKTKPVGKVKRNPKEQTAKCIFHTLGCKSKADPFAYNQMCPRHWDLTCKIKDLTW